MIEKARSRHVFSGVELFARKIRAGCRHLHAHSEHVTAENLCRLVIVLGFVRKNLRGNDAALARVDDLLRRVAGREERREERNDDIRDEVRQFLTDARGKGWTKQIRTRHLAELNAFLVITKARVDARRSRRKQLLQDREQRYTTLERFLPASYKRRKRITDENYSYGSYVVGDDDGVNAQRLKASLEEGLRYLFEGGTFYQLNDVSLTTFARFEDMYICKLDVTETKSRTNIPSLASAVLACIWNPFLWARNEFTIRRKTSSEIAMKYFRSLFRQLDNDQRVRNFYAELEFGFKETAGSIINPYDHKDFVDKVVAEFRDYFLVVKIESEVDALHEWITYFPWFVFHVIRASDGTVTTYDYDSAKSDAVKQKNVMKSTRKLIARLFPELLLSRRRMQCLLYKEDDARYSAILDTRGFAINELFDADAAVAVAAAGGFSPARRRRTPQSSPETLA